MASPLPTLPLYWPASERISMRDVWFVYQCLLLLRNVLRWSINQRTSQLYRNGLLVETISRTISRCENNSDSNPTGIFLLCFVLCLFFVFCFFFLVCYSGCGVRLQRLKAYLLYVAKGTPPWLLIYLERLKIIFVVVTNLSDLRQEYYLRMSQRNAPELKSR